VKNKNRLQKDLDTEKRRAEIRTAEAQRRLEKNRWVRKEAAEKMKVKCEYRGCWNLVIK
jgi:hypothetical protein